MHKKSQTSLPQSVVMVTSGTELGGAELNTLALLKQLEDWGVSTYLITSHVGELFDAFKKVTQSQLITPIPYPTKPLTWVRGFRFFSQVKKFLAKIEDENPVFWVSDLYPLWASVSLKKKLPYLGVIAYWQGEYNFLNAECLNKWKRYGAAQADVLVASQPVAEHMNHNLCLPQAVRVLNPRIDRSRFDERKYNREAIRQRMKWGDAGERVAICVGQVDEGKGQRWLAEQFLDNPSLYKNWRLVIVGPFRSKEAEHFKTLLARDIDNKIELLGKRDDVAELLAGADLALFPGTANESFGMAVLEAASMDVPVLATDPGAVAYTLKGYSGLVSVEARNRLIDLWLQATESDAFLKQLKDQLPRQQVEALLSSETWEGSLLDILKVAH